jgi:hypothetical protein
MCFQIEKFASRPRSRIAYKIVTRTPAGYLRSVTGKRFKPKGQYWSTPGATVHRSKGPTSKEGNWGSGNKNAAHGIYVFRTVKDAKNMLWSPGQVILKVLVDPADWLHNDRYAGVATYEKVTIAEDQPYLDWY